MSLRIIAGRHRGRRLSAPPGLLVRPTAERAREALFAVLDVGLPPLRGSRFLDLFAGSGAVGLEALSRGAAEVLFVEQAAGAAASIARNIEVLGAAPQAALRRVDVLRIGQAPHPFDIAFLDPPYGSGLVVPAIAALHEGSWLAARARIVVELAAREPVPSNLAIEDDRRYGAARFLFLRALAG